jgi:putative transposase
MSEAKSGYYLGMVRYRRNRIAGGTFFFTLTLANRQSTALVDHVDILRAAFRVTRSERPFTVEAIVVLPDHLHAILTLPLDDSDFPALWRRLKGYFSNRILEAGKNLQRHASGELALWQRRYWEHTIRDDDDFARHVDYIHFNPVKHRLVRRVRDWPLSSFHFYVRRGLLPADWAGEVEADASRFGERA